MSAIQQVIKSPFGTGRIYKTLQGALGPYQLAIMNDISIDLKSENKTAYSEGNFPVLAADGHKSIEITAKNYAVQLQDLADDFGGGLSSAQPVASASGFIFSEIGTVTSHAYTLVQGASLVAGTAAITGYFTNSAGVAYSLPYVIVASGPVAGISCTISSVGLITFASGDTVQQVSVDYEYTNTAGQSILISNTYQNSSPTYAVTVAKRDRSPLDSSLGVLAVTFYAVRPAGIKIPLKEGDFADFDRSWMVLADPLGRVMSMTFINE